MADLLILSVFWVVCSLPLVTIGPATAALYHTVVHCIRGDERNSWGLFFRTFKSNFKVGALTSLVVVPLIAVLVILHEMLYQMALVDNTGYMLYFAYRVFLLLPVGALCYVFPVLSRFTFQVSGLLVTCGKLAIAHLPSTVLMAVIAFAALLVCSNILILRSSCLLWWCCCTLSCWNGFSGPIWRSSVLRRMRTDGRDDSGQGSWPQTSLAIHSRSVCDGGRI